MAAAAALLAGCQGANHTGGAAPSTTSASVHEPPAAPTEALPPAAPPRRPASPVASTTVEEPHHELGLLARHVGFTNLIQVAGTTVLIGCDAVRILDADLVKGRDVVKPKLAHPPGQQCGSDPDASVALATIGDAVVVRGSDDHLVLVHVPSGKVEPYAVLDGGGPGWTKAPSPSSTETVIGKTRYRVHGVLEAIDVDTGRTLWTTKEQVSLPVLSEGTLLVAEPAALDELDPATGKVLWQRGVPFGGARPLQLTADGADVVAAFEASNDRAPQVVLLQRGAPPEPLWTGKVSGVVSFVGEDTGAAPGAVVTAGTATARTDARGRYQLTLSARGSFRVSSDQMGAGMTSESKIIDITEGHGPYKVDLHVATFKQSCL